MIYAALASLLPLLATAAPVANLTAPLPPTGGVDVNATSPPPDYMYKSEFDYQSLAVRLSAQICGANRATCVDRRTDTGPITRLPLHSAFES